MTYWYEAACPNPPSSLQLIIEDLADIAKMHCNYSWQDLMHNSPDINMATALTITFSVSANYINMRMDLFT